MKKNHWIILNNTEHKIWGEPYLSYEEAKKELDKINGLDNWSIEMHDHWVKD